MDFGRQSTKLHDVALSPCDASMNKAIGNRDMAIPVSVVSTIHPTHSAIYFTLSNNITRS